MRLVNTATGHDWSGKAALWWMYFDKRFSPPYMGLDQKFRQLDMPGFGTLKYSAHTTGWPSSAARRATRWQAERLRLTE